MKILLLAALLLSTFSFISCFEEKSTGPACVKHTDTLRIHDTIRIKESPTLPANFFQDSVLAAFGTTCTGCHNPAGGMGWMQTGADSGGLYFGVNPSEEGYEWASDKDSLASVVYALLVNKPTYTARDTAPFVRVKPGDLEGSYLYHKLTPTINGVERTYKSGGQMPGEEIAPIIKRWIEAGAPRK